MRSFLFIIFVLIAFYRAVPVIMASNKGHWKRVEVLKVIDNERFMTKRYRIIRINGIDSADIYHPSRRTACLSRPIQRTLQKLLEGATVKIFEDGTQNKKGDYPRHVKLKDKTNLTKFMLERGLGKIPDGYENPKYFRAYFKAQEKAKSEKWGLWKGCNNWNNLAHWKYKKGLDPIFYKKYKNFRHSIATGWVEEVLSGVFFRLKNGLKVELIGAMLPPENGTEAAQCFRRESKQYLTNLIGGRKVFLVKDKSQLNPKNNLWRYVYLPQTRYRNQIFVNKNIIQNGFGKFVSNGIDTRFDTLFMNSQAEAYAHPDGAWRTCIKSLLTDKKVIEEPKEKPLVYDESCRIKGNISGTKKKRKKTYHTPRSGWYKRIVAERCFETAEAAELAGFRKIK